MKSCEPIKKAHENKSRRLYNIRVFFITDSPLVRTTGLEPTRRKTLDPKSSAATNYATSANDGTNIQEVYKSYNESGYKVCPRKG